jgi:hypothetical protein
MPAATKLVEGQVTIETLTLVAGVALLLGTLALLLCLWLVLRTARLARLGSFRPQMPADLQSALERESERIDVLTRALDDVQRRLPAVEGRALTAVQRVGIVRFNPFEDTGGQQSFALALLDAHGSGFVMSSLHARQGTRVYLKQIAQGKSETPLSDEEAQALRDAGAGGSQLP